MDPFIGEIVMFGGNFAPRGWAFCQGQLLAISSHTALFSILGTTYGGDGRTTFALPDLRGRTAIQPGTGPGLSNIKLGQRGGAEYHTLTVSQMPNHSHNVSFSGGGVNAAVSLPAVADEGTSDEASGNILASGITNLYASPSAADATLAPANAAISGSVNTMATGGNQSFYIRNPFEGINFIIAMVGVYPSRS
ncbi:microcystin-dependent protein [Kordia periserrulae]|uniref:Microcystin-dependent protein n=1 Tax=Kordia periserrulae TaxID=701523 RepID=A0A2T6C471_9FLAO|nr:tail fiber protein [Kordia periserrulae]PTX63116.1 microcystin-dependent protein [Kordia periserrulae]